eukprot:COSAG05_NODE_57_length_23291_cov_75.862668_35_plen_37_part_00
MFCEFATRAETDGERGHVIAKQDGLEDIVLTCTGAR